MTDADAYEQTERAIEIVGEALREVDGDLSDVVRTRLYVTEIDDWEAVGRAHGAVFGDVQPATTMVEVASLIEPGLVVEVEAKAVVDDSDGE
jgi:enamine deaminase RidA (YjgF/YER057c/UK114 family)